jgi:hypothetical protein
MFALLVADTGRKHRPTGSHAGSLDAERSDEEEWRS